VIFLPRVLVAIAVLLCLSLSALADEGNASSDWFVKGNELLLQGSPEDAIAAYDLFLANDSRNVAALSNKAAALTLLGSFQEAADLCDEAIGINGDYPLAWSTKGDALSGLGQFQEAVSAYDRALKLNSEAAVTWFNKGVALGNMGRYDEAVQAYNESLRINPDMAGPGTIRALHCPAWEDMKMHSSPTMKPCGSIPICLRPGRTKGCVWESWGDTMSR